MSSGIWGQKRPDQPAICVVWSDPEVIKLPQCSTQLGIKYVLLIKLKLLTIANSFLLHIADHEHFPANKYENANWCRNMQADLNLHWVQVLNMYSDVAALISMSRVTVITPNVCGHAWAKSIDPENAASDLDLHCLLLIQHYFRHINRQ